MEKRAKIAFGLAIASLVVNLMFLSIEGVPLSIPFGIMAIAFALSSRNGKGEFPPKAKPAFIMGIIGMVFGFIMYFMILQAVQTMQDPENAQEIIRSMKELIKQLPENLQQYFSIDRLAGLY